MCMSQIPTPPTRRIRTKACPRCGRPKPSKRTDDRRPRAPTVSTAYEERWAAARGVIAIQLIVSGPGHHDINECVARAQDSPAAWRRMIASLVSRAIGPELQYEPKWQSTLTAIAGLADALAAPRRPR
jgi:hypothetical protein